MMTLVMGGRSSKTVARACELGVAMQLTNIARDVGEDARRGRLYLPLQWLREAGLDPDEFLRHPQHSPALANVVKRLLRAADQLYVRSETGIGALPRDCRAAIMAARLIYASGPLHLFHGTTTGIFIAALARHSVSGPRGTGRRSGRPSTGFSGAGHRYGGATQPPRAR